MSKPIKIPPKMEESLEPDFTLSGFVKSTVSEFAPWLEQNNVKFFSEYTDHSLKHVENVLETADKLIRENCREIFGAGDNKKKYNIKFELIRQCYALGYSKYKTRSFLNFVDYLIHLPEYLEKRLSEEIIKIEEENKMPYVASWERIAKKEGEKIGEKRGEIKGKLETARELVKNGVDIDIIAKATGFPREEIEKLVANIH